MAPDGSDRGRAAPSPGAVHRPVGTLPPMSEQADDPRDDSGRPDPATEGIRERFGAFYVIYVGLFALLFAYLISVRVAEELLENEFQDRVARAIVVTHFDRPVREQIEQRIEAAVRDSAWVRWGGLKVNTLVLAQDDRTWLYVDGHGALLPEDEAVPGPLISEWMAYLPAKARVEVTLPNNALVSNLILILYSSILLSVVYVSNRRVTLRETERLGNALESRNRAADRAAEIESELEATRSRLAQIEPVEREQNDEIQALERERAALNAQLAQLAQREEALRGRAERAVDLAEEVRALEDLLEEATGDLATKDDEIGRLEQNLKKVSRSSGKARTRAAEILARRFRTLYKTIEIDDRAIDDIAALGDESLRLKAEECVKRLAEEAENVAVRRKVGGLPAHVVAFEMGFAGKGRIYYARGKSKRFRILLVGAKNRQAADLDYLASLPRDTYR